MRENGSVFGPEERDSSIPWSGSVGSTLWSRVVGGSRAPAWSHLFSDESMKLGFLCYLKDKVPMLDNL